MKHLVLFEDYDIKSHLKDRGIDMERVKPVIDEESNNVYFYLYNLSGQLVGYQKYNPLLPKIGQNKLSDPKLAKYYTWVTDEPKGNKIAVWGLESTEFTDKYLFITEGIFDAARIHEAGYPAIAILGNDPSPQLKNWLSTLPQKKIVIYDNDKAGIKLKKVGNISFTVTHGKDMNDLNPEEAKEFLENCLSKLF